MIWRELKNHFDDCYFCEVNICGINRNNRNKWAYPDLDSARRPLPHSESEMQQSSPFLPVPHDIFIVEDKQYSEKNDNEDESYDEFEASSDDPKLFFSRGT